MPGCLFVFLAGLPWSLVCNFCTYNPQQLQRPGFLEQRKELETRTRRLAQKHLRISFALLTPNTIILVVQRVERRGLCLCELPSTHTAGHDNSYCVQCCQAFLCIHQVQAFFISQLAVLLFTFIPLLSVILFLLGFNEPGILWLVVWQVSGHMQFSGLSRLVPCTAAAIWFWNRSPWVGVGLWNSGREGRREA